MVTRVSGGGNPWFQLVRREYWSKDQLLGDAPTYIKSYCEIEFSLIAVVDYIPCMKWVIPPNKTGLGTVETTCAAACHVHKKKLR